MKQLAWRELPVVAALTCVALACGCDGSDGPVSNTPAIGVVVNPATFHVLQGTTKSVGVAVTRAGGFGGVVTLAVTGLPTGVTASITPAQLSGTTRAATVTVVIGGSVDARTYPATITATAQGVSDAIATLKVGIIRGSGSVNVTTETSGVDLDPDGYEIQVTDDPWFIGYLPVEIATNGTVQYGLTATAHTLSLVGVSPNCRGEKLTDRPIVVSANAVTSVVFRVECGAAASGTVSGGR
jgi:hypothetical protein